MKNNLWHGLSINGSDKKKVINIFENIKKNKIQIMWYVDEL